MFTGIVREVGGVRRLAAGRLVVEAELRAGVGGSVAVNGACLTVVESGRGELAFDVVPETLARTNLGRLEAGERVNLEPALSLEQRLDGHLVQGHVDGTARVLEVRAAELGRTLAIELPASLGRFVAEKGSVAVDGTSLTVTAVGEGFFGVALIPHTIEHTIAGGYQPGTTVNLEVDVLARYVERLLDAKRTQ